MESYLDSDKTPESESHFAKSIVDSVLNDSEVGVIDSEGVKGGAKFSDGHSLINAFKLLKNLNSPLKKGPKNADQKWQVWYWKRSAYNDSRKWKEFLQMKSSFTTRKEFWSAYNEVNGYEFGLLSRHFDYCVFKEGIVPMWEDPSNRNGGRWILEFPRRKDWRHISFLDRIWLKVLLAITGTEDEIHEYLDEICGCVLMIRHEINKIAVWTKNSNNTLVNLKIGELLKSSTGFGGKMYYMSHDSTIKKILVRAQQKIRFNLKARPDLRLNQY